MEPPQLYLNLAEEAGREGAHVASVMYYRTAAELTTANEELKIILEAVIKYASKLKKPMDQLATYNWALRVIVGRLQSEPLEKIVTSEMAKIMQHSE